MLDIGVGTGWTTALLAARVGSENVAGIELDREVAGAAACRLGDAGYGPHILTGDGGAGWAPGASYDRVHVTFAVRQVPQPWIEQTRPGGLIVVPWVTWFSNGGAVARLTVSADNATASGRFTRPAEFMLDRGQRGTWPVHTDYVPGGEWPADTIESATTLRPDDMWASPYGVAEFVVGLMVPDVVHSVNAGDDGSLVAWFYSLTCRSWAVLAGHPGSREPLEVYQGGGRRLWEEVEYAYRWWERKDRPGHHRFGLTARAGGCTIWLDDPSEPVPSLG